MKTDEFQFHAYSKGTLSRLYNPGLSLSASLRMLNRWIDLNIPLQEELARLGYSKSLRILSPQMVRVIVTYLGEP